MTLMGFIVLLVIAAIAGALGQAIAGYSLGGCLISTIVGFIGAFIGIWIAQQLGLPEIFNVTVEGESFPVIWAILGSALFTAIIGLFSRRRYVA